MAITDPGTRSYYLDDHADEVVPCDCTLDGWANWLAVEDSTWEHDIPGDGATFDGSATLWLPDIVATYDGEQWELSREPDGDFLAVRFQQGSGWDADAIAGDCLIETLDECCGDAKAGQVEYVACGKHEGGYRFTFHCGPPPTLSAERVQ